MSHLECKHKYLYEHTYQFESFLDVNMRVHYDECTESACMQYTKYVNHMLHNLLHPTAMHSSSAIILCTFFSRPGWLNCHISVVAQYHVIRTMFKTSVMWNNDSRIGKPKSAMINAFFMESESLYCTRMSH